MSSPAPFIDVTGFPAPGEPVAPTPRAATHLIAGGWTPPAEGPRDLLGTDVPRVDWCNATTSFDGGIRCMLHVRHEGSEHHDSMVGVRWQNSPGAVRGSVVSEGPSWAKRDAQAWIDRNTVSA